MQESVETPKATSSKTHLRESGIRRGALHVGTPIPRALGPEVHLLRGTGHPQPLWLLHPPHLVVGVREHVRGRTCGGSEPLRRPRIPVMGSLHISWPEERSHHPVRPRTWHRHPRRTHEPSRRPDPVHLTSVDEPILVEGFRFLSGIALIPPFRVSGVEIPKEIEPSGQKSWSVTNLY